MVPRARPAAGRGDVSIGASARPSIDGADHAPRRTAVAREKHRNGRTNGALPSAPDLGREEIARLLEVAVRRRVEPGHPVLVEGQPAEGLVLVVSGRLAVHRPVPDGSSVFLYELKSGQVCAASLLAALTGRRLPLSLSARTVSDVAVVDAGVIRLRFENDASFRKAALELLARRLEMLLLDLEQVTAWSREARLCDLLLARGPVVRASHRELARELGCSREWISRLLGALQAEGLVSCGYERIEVRDADRLAERLAASRTGPLGSGESLRSDS
ncbi:MAG: hypothetical protein Kow0062_04240 [Acidobacteriota bacterium]